MTFSKLKEQCGYPVTVGIQPPTLGLVLVVHFQDKHMHVISTRQLSSIKMSKGLIHLIPSLPSYSTVTFFKASAQSWLTPGVSNLGKKVFNSRAEGQLIFCQSSYADYFASQQCFSMYFPCVFSICISFLSFFFLASVSLFLKAWFLEFVICLMAFVTQSNGSHCQLLFSFQLHSACLIFPIPALQHPSLFKQHYIAVQSLLASWPMAEFIWSSIPQHCMTTAHTCTEMHGFTNVLTNLHTYKLQCYTFTLLFNNVVTQHKW